MKALRPLDVVNQANRNGVSIGRFKITKEQARQLREAEKKGHNEAVRTLLGFLRTKQA